MNPAQDIARRWFSLRELAALGLNGMPTTREGMRLLAEREGWNAPGLEGFVWRRRLRQGGGVEYSVRALPIEAQVALMVRNGGPHLVSLLAALHERLGVEP